MEKGDLNVPFPVSKAVGSIHETVIYPSTSNAQGHFNWAAVAFLVGSTSFCEGGWPRPLSSPGWLGLLPDLHSFEPPAV